MLTGIAKRYYYDDPSSLCSDAASQVALQTSVSGGTETDEKYFIFGNYIDEVLLMSVIPAQAGIQDYYYGYDHLFSPVALFESDGDVVERYEYDVYGAVRILTSGYSLLTSSQYGNPYTFTGRELDTFDCTPPAVGCTLYYYRARSYDPQTGRFLQRDPMQYIDGMNLYEYVRSSPVNYNDPSGSVIDNPWDAFLHYIFGNGGAERLGDGFWSRFKGSDAYRGMTDDLREKGVSHAECDNIVTYEISEDYSGVVTADLNWNYDPVLNFAIGTITKVSITGDCSVSCGMKQKIKEGCCCRCVMRCKAHFNLFNNYNWNGDNNVIFRLLGMHKVGTTYDMTGDFNESIRRSLVKCP